MAIRLYLTGKVEEGAVLRKLSIWSWGFIVLIESKASSTSAVPPSTYFRRMPESTVVLSALDWSTLAQALAEEVPEEYPAQILA